MLKYDSTHGVLKTDVHAVDEKTLQVGSQTIKVFGCRYEPHSHVSWLQNEFCLKHQFRSSGFFFGLVLTQEML